MLVRFNFRNFLSFSKRIEPNTEKLVSHEFSMIPGKVRSKQEHIAENETQNLLKFAALYGANASGKSNVIKAMNFMQFIVLQGKAFVDSTEMFCKTKAENKKEASFFSIEVLLDSHCYEYGFEIHLATGLIVSEWLYEIGKNREKKLYERDEKGTFSFDNELKDIKNLAIYAGDIGDKSNVLFLHLMNQNKDGFYQKNSNARILAELYTWFRESLVINYPDQSFTNYSYFMDMNNVDKVVNYLKEFDTGISDIVFKKITIEQLYDRIPKGLVNRIKEDVQSIKQKFKIAADEGSVEKKIRWAALIRSNKEMLIIELDAKNELVAKEIIIRHRNSTYDFNFLEESDGTIRLFDLIEMLVATNKRTYVIDELDRFLHPCLTFKFVELFLSHVKEQNIQLIVTTHESRLLDFDLLRRDEVWFVNKNQDGESSIYSLEEFNERFDKKIDKAYLEGRYGGVPLFTTLFPLEKD